MNFNGIYAKTKNKHDLQCFSHCFTSNLSKKMRSTKKKYDVLREKKNLMKSQSFVQVDP